MRATARRREDMNEAAVAAWLRANPGFLADNPGLYHHLVPPVRVHGEALADHMAAMLRAARAEADGVLAAGRAAAGLAGRVQEAVLLLIGAADVAECVGAEFPTALAVDAASLCVESDMTGWRGLAAGTVAGLMGSRAVLFRSHAAPDPQLHEAACLLATHEALVRIPGDGPPAMLALAARDGMTLDPLQGAGALAFLGRALAVALGR